MNHIISTAFWEAITTSLRKILRACLRTGSISTWTYFPAPSPLQQVLAAHTLLLVLTLTQLLAMTRRVRTGLRTADSKLLVEQNQQSYYPSSTTSLHLQSQISQVRTCRGLYTWNLVCKWLRYTGYILLEITREILCKTSTTHFSTILNINLLQSSNSFFSLSFGVCTAESPLMTCLQRG